MEVYWAMAGTGPVEEAVLSRIETEHPKSVREQCYHNLSDGKCY